MKQTRLFQALALVACLLCSLGSAAAEAYACYTPSNTTLHFYYDNVRSSRTNTYDLNTGTTDPGWYSIRSSVTKVDFNSAFANARPTSTYRWFDGMSNLTSITGINYLNTSQVTTMYSMFHNCSGLTSLDVSNFNTSNVTNMYAMFWYCSGLTSLDVSNFNTSKVTNMQYMFYECSGLTSLNLSNFNTSQVTTMNSMFAGCSGLYSLDLSNFNTSNVTNMSSMFQNCSKMSDLDVSNFNTSKVTTMYGMFSGCKRLVILDLSSFNTSNVTSMIFMFHGCTNLYILDLSSFNTSKVTYMTKMFYGCSNLTRIYVGSGWSMAAVTSSADMFTNCTSLIGGMGTTYDANHTDAAYAHGDGGTSNPGYFIDINAPQSYACYTSSNKTLTFYYDTQRSSRTGTTYDVPLYELIDPYWNEPMDVGYLDAVTVVFDPSFAAARPKYTNSWFQGFNRLQNIIGLEYLNTSQVTTMNSMFEYCSGLTSLDLSSFNTSNVTYMGWMFNGCTGLETLDLSSFNTAKVTIMGDMFWGCNNLTTIYVGSGWNTDAVIWEDDQVGDEMFYGCTSLVGGKGTTFNPNHIGVAYAHIDGGTSNPGYFTEKLEAYACYTPSNTTLTFYYDSQRVTRTGTTYDLNEGDDSPGWYTDGTMSSVTQVVFDPSFSYARPTSTRFWFCYMENLQSVTGMEYLNTNEVTNMRSMFYGCSGLTSLDVSHFNTSKVTTMHCMFYNCSGLTSLDLSNFNTSNVTTMQSMFNGCSGLTSLDVSHFNTSNVTTMYYMFYNCSGLTSLDVSHFNTSNVTTMHSMFNKCSGLTSLDVSHFNTSKVEVMQGMFYNCNGLTSLDLSNFNTVKVTNMSYMFRGCSNLATIYVGNDWNTAAVTNSNLMFQSCTKLVGGMGTTYDADHIDATYAHIDGGTANPGYFTVGTEAYACYTSSNKTLTFYYDNQRSSRTGATYSLNEDESTPAWLEGNAETMRQVVFDPSFADARPTVTKAWFFGMGQIRSITGIEYLNTTNVTNMLGMFELCSRLKSLDLSHFNTAKVTTMNGMFLSCYNLTELDLSHFNTANVTDMDCMFYGCSSLATIYVGSSWSTEAVTTTTNNNMFYGCTSLVGGMGTTYDANHVDVTYAHVDGGTANPGYLTAKGTTQPGDVSGDGEIDVNDVTMMISSILNDTPVDLATADMNGDNVVDVLDVTMLIAFILNN